MPWCSNSQLLNGEELLNKAIEYHDPNDLWKSFNGQFLVTMETPNKSDRNTEITIDILNEFFNSKALRDSTTIVFTVEKELCEITYNGSKEFSEEIAKEYRLNCDRAKMYRNYYTYLYGLPMKLKDPGTVIHEEVETINFQGVEYLVLKATYTEEVGEDIWYFYFNPHTYAMEVYQFFHDESKNDGEYILLSDEEIVNGIKMPKARAWYMNKDDKYLGIDILNSRN
jgi:hypothetical protein